MAKAPAFDRTGRTYVWTAPLDVDQVHPWTAGALRDAAAALAPRLAADDTAFTVTSPMPGLEAALARADAARGRLLIVRSLGVAILLAFGVFVALVIREDVGAEIARLRVRSRMRVGSAFLVLEAMIPAAIGGIAGWGVAAVVVAALSAWSGSDAGAHPGRDFAWTDAPRGGAARNRRGHRGHVLATARASRGQAASGSRLPSP